MHTPGPWTAETFNGGGFDIKAESSCLIICARNDAPRIEESKANALLIAAAPELLEALKEAVQFGKEELESTGGCDHSVGICACGVIRMVKSWEQLIKKAEAKP